MDGLKRSMRKPANRFGKRASPIRKTTTRSRWRRASQREKSSSASAAPSIRYADSSRHTTPTPVSSSWRFYTIPGDPSKPFENPALKKAAETWSGEWWKLGGGGTVWDGVAYDPESELVYVGTGNGGPWPEELRQSKGKDNLYVCSILAVKSDTGELKWYYQMVPGDSWDFDSVQQLMLADVTINGRPRKVIMQANKNGFYYVLDRVTGAFISAQPFAQVTWAKGIDQETGRPIINPEAHYDQNDDTVSIAPGPGGAHNWSPMSYNPGNRSGLHSDDDDKFVQLHRAEGFQICAGPAEYGHLCSPFRAPAEEAAGAALATPAPPAAKTLPAIGPAPKEGQRGALVAWDLSTQKERWRGDGGAGIGGGTFTTAGNLVFQVIPDGRLVAYSADKGEKLLEVQTGLRGGMGPPITYMLDGKQYVAFMGGTGPILSVSAHRRLLLHPPALPAPRPQTSDPTSPMPLRLNVEEAVEEPHRRAGTRSGRSGRPTSGTATCDAEALGVHAGWQRDAAGQSTGECKMTVEAHLT